MKQLMLCTLVLTIFLSCKQTPETNPETKTEISPEISPETTTGNTTETADLKEMIQGSWRLVYAETRENDSVQVTDLSKIEFMKIMNQDHFAFFNQQKGSDEHFLAGGGRYSFDGVNYVETLEFVNVMALRGHEFPFKVEIKGDSLIQNGHEKVPEAGLDRYILEKYVRIKSSN